MSKTLVQKIEHFRERLRDKIGARNLADVTREAVRFGIIEVEVLI